MSDLQFFIILTAIWSADATAGQRELISVLWGMVNVGLLLYWVLSN